MKYQYFIRVAFALAIIAGGAATRATATPASFVDSYFPKTRVLVLTDIGNEPDDQMSLVRLLLYSNEIDIEGLEAVTSTWLKTKTNPQTIREIVADYGVVRPNLQKNAQGWPSKEALDK